MDHCQDNCHNNNTSLDAKLPENTDLDTNTVNFVLIGHVDHGKSTCAGRILVDTNTVTDREVEKAMSDANENGMRSWWLAYLLDSDEERVKGKTHEFTIVPIKYKDHNVNLIDVPGHRKFVREMISGSSRANLGVLICSAKKGEIEAGLKGQTFEHLILARGMGINKLIVAVNKMDHETVNWDMELFNKIKNKIDKLINKLRFKEVRYIPVSALEGINIVNVDNDNNKYNSKESLMDLIVDTEVENNVLSIYPNRDKLRARCLFINLDKMITLGYSCNLHSGEKIVGCKIGKFYQNKPFITTDNKGYVDVGIILEYPIDICTQIILRNGDKTIGIGKIVTREDLKNKNK